MTQNGMTPLHGWGLLGVSGLEAKAFLQGQLTCNMESITVLQSKLGGHCNLKGRLQSVFQIMLIENAAGPLYLLMMPIDMITQAKQQLKKFALFSKVTFTDLTQSMPLIGLCSDKTKWSGLEINHCVTENLPEGHYTVRRVQGETPRFVIICESSSVYQALAPQLQQSYGEISSNQWELLDIEAGLPTIYPKTVDQVLPHHVNLDLLEGISFDKGCYLGQEIIARMHYKGKIKKHLYKASVDASTPPHPGDPIRAEGASLAEAPGTVIRVATIDNGYRILAVLDDNDAQSGKLMWDDHRIFV